MNDTPSPVAGSLEALSAARRTAVRLEQVKAQVAAVEQAISTLSALVAEMVAEQQQILAARTGGLGAQVLAEYSAVCARLDAAREAYDDLAQSLDDSIRQHAEGKISDADFARTQRSSEQALRTRATELAALDQLRARFLAEFEQLGDGAPPPLPVQRHRPDAAPAATPPAPAAPIDDVLPDLEGSTEEPLDADDEAPAVSGHGTVVLDTASGSPAPPDAATESVPAALVETSDLDVPTAPIAGAPPGRPPMAKALLIEAHRASSGAAHAVGAGLSIGRATDNSLRILDPSVSRQHAAIELDEGEFVIEDRQSQNGTYVNGERVRRHALRDGDRIGIGEAEFVFRLSGDPNDTPVGGTPLGIAAKPGP